MLIKTSYKDVPTKAGGKDGKMRIYVIEPNMPDYPQAKYPGVVVVRYPLMRDCLTFTIYLVQSVLMIVL